MGRQSSFTNVDCTPPQERPALDQAKRNLMESKMLKTGHMLEHRQVAHWHLGTLLYHKVKDQSSGPIYSTI